MSHTHSHAVGNIRLAFFLNLSFTVVEIVGGILTGSLAILSDAIHDLGDSLSLGLAWYLERYAERGQDSRFSYGYRRFSLLGALINAVILLAGSLFILSHALPALADPRPVHAPGMIFIAVIGVAANGMAVLRMRTSRSMNARVVAWHLLEDVLGWVAVLVVGIALLFTDNYILDPILSILIALYVLFNVVKNLRETLGLFLQSVPAGIIMDDITERMRAVTGVCGTHHTNIWSLDGEHHVLTTHLVVDEQAERQQVRRIKDDVKRVLQEYDFTHVTLELEYGDADCAAPSGLERASAPGDATGDHS